MIRTFPSLVNGKLVIPLSEIHIAGKADGLGDRSGELVSSTEYNHQAIGN